MNLQEALDVLEGRLGAEVEAADEGLAYLDAEEIDALRIAVEVVKDALINDEEIGEEETK